jgi:hypothetical protein
MYVIWDKERLTFYNLALTIFQIRKIIGPYQIEVFKFKSQFSPTKLFQLQKFIIGFNCSHGGVVFLLLSSMPPLAIAAM